MAIKRRTFLLSALATVAAPAVLRAQSKPHIIGTLFPMSGPNAEFGTMYSNGVQLALEHMKADNLLKGAVDVRVVDSQATAQGGAIGMTRLASVDQASYVLIGFTGVSKAAAPIGDRAKVVMINGGGVGPDLATLSPYFWNILPLADQEVRAALPYFKAKNLKRVAMIYSDDPAGLALHAELKNGLPTVGSALVGAYSMAPGLTQFAAIAAQIREVKPDVVFFASIVATQGVQIIKQLRDNGVPQQLMTYSSGNLPSINSLPEAEGMIFTGQQADWGTDEGTMKRFVTGWRTKHGQDPSTYALNYYNATLLFGQLARDLEAQGKPVNGENLRASMLKLKKFKLAGGEVTFAENGTASTGVQLNIIKGGRIEKLTI
jgi:ABC-type branched-subunit amino acid transport system substrate-binding protein